MNLTPTKTERPVIPEMGYERYMRLMGVATEINHNFEGAFSVLDIGGEDAALRQFIPQAEYSTYSGFITNETPAPQSDNSVDVVVAADVLEHVPAHDRTTFLRELLRIARKRVVFSFPQQAANIHEQFLLSIMPNHRWLKEHQENGLPDPVAVEKILQELGVDYKASPNHSLPSWIYSVLFDHQAIDEETRRYLNVFMQMTNYDTGSDGECYRVIYTVDI